MNDVAEVDLTIRENGSFSDRTRQKFKGKFV